VGEAEHDGGGEEGAVAFFVGGVFEEGADVWDEASEGGAGYFEFGSVGGVEFCCPSDCLGTAGVAVEGCDRVWVYARYVFGLLDCTNAVESCVASLKAGCS
jgi:hypothetical protein